MESHYWWLWWVQMWVAVVVMWSWVMEVVVVFGELGLVPQKMRKLEFERK